MSGTPNSIITPQVPKTSTCVCTTANSNYTDSPTNTQILYSAGVNGARITRVGALARATNSATECQLFVSSDGGTTKRFVKSKLMPAYTVAQTTEQIGTDLGFSESMPLILGGSEILFAAIGVSNTGIVFRAEGGDF